MDKPTAILLTLTLSAAVGAALAGCNAPHPAIRSGDANSVEVSYGGDVASALPLARQHCARYERAPRLSDAGLDVAIFDCVRR
jgi:hypothetical protein